MTSLFASLIEFFHVFRNQAPIIKPSSSQMDKKVASDAKKHQYRETLHHPESDSRRKRRRNRKNGLTIAMIQSRWQGHRARRGLYRGLLLRGALRRTGGVGGGRIGGRRRVFMLWCCHLMMAGTLVSHKIT